VKSSRLQSKTKSLLRTPILLGAIVLTGFLLRVWRVNDYPPLLWDEAALGYNAYSILKTGRDEYGKLLPLIFKSFGDYKPGLYVYLSLPFVAIFGLNELAVRLPSIILGSLTPLFLYLLVKELFGDKRIALFCAVALTFLPWHIHFSRGAWEVNVMTLLLILGSWLMIRKSEIRNPKFEIVGKILPFLLALWLYQGAKMMVPLVLGGLVILNWGDWLRLVRENRGRLSKGLVGLVSVILILMGGWYIQSFRGPAKNRLKVMSLFSYPRPRTEIEQILKEEDTPNKNRHFYLFHGEWLHFLRGFSLRYFNYFSPRFLAFEGDWSNPRHSAPYFGMIGHINFVLFLFGLTCFLSQKHPPRNYFFLYWLAVAPLPAALSRDITSGVRALPMAIPLVFFIASGVYFMVRSFKSKFLRIMISCLLLIVFLLDFIYWSDLYFTHMVKRRPKEWLYGYKQVIEFIGRYKNKANKIVLTDFYGQPYIYYLFYVQYPPESYQREAYLIENQFGDVGRVESVDGISFVSVNRDLLKSCRSCLIIFSQDEVLRAGIDKDSKLFSRLIPLGTVGNNWANFYAYLNL